MSELLNLFFCSYVVIVASILINTRVLRLQPPQTQLYLNLCLEEV